MNIKIMAKKKTEKNIEKLLNEQTNVILTAVDEKLVRLDKKIDFIDEKFEKRIAKLEMKVDKRFDELITSLNRFLKRLSDIEDEFAIIKTDLNRVKQVIKDKLRVDLI